MAHASSATPAAARRGAVEGLPLDDRTREG
jgi:hypothetical protein